MNPYLINRGEQVSADAGAVLRSFVAHLVYADPAVGAIAAVHAAVTDTGVEVEVTTAITDPDFARAITATAGGTAADIGAIQVTVVGTDMADEALTEVLPVFTVNSAGSVTGSKAFKTVTSITIPAHDGTGATTSVGTSDKLGVPYKLEHNSVLNAFLDDTLEGTAPTVAVSDSVLGSNTIDLNSALDGTKVDVYLLV